MFDDRWLVDYLEQELDPTTIQEINFTVNFEWAGNTTMSFNILEEAKETILDFS